MKKKINLADVNERNRIIWCYFILLGIGLLQIYSSSSIFALENYGTSLYFIKKQLFFALLASCWFVISIYLPQRFYIFLGGLVFVASFVGVILTNIPSIGVTIGGASRWLNLFGGFRIEPGEFLKVGFGFFIYWLLFLKEKKENMSVFWPFTITLFLCLGLFLKQPDFGSVLLLVLSTLVVLFIWIRRVFPFLILGLASILGLVYFLTAESYRVQRLMTFLDPWQDPQGKGFQTIQSFVAFKKGGFLGEGIGMSQSKFFFLPEAHTDFTLAVFSEEWGFVGFLFLLLVYMFLIFTLLKKSLKQQGNFKVHLLSYYLGMLFFFCVAINFCVNLGLVPTKGLPLPFLSYGGSSLFATTFLLGFFVTRDKGVKY